ncbi:MAG: hypothetical protein JWM11_5151 [Planctomycetaceae bacterium]|nr:hypothetical protein [Planctomycetaceae bacterium]
MSQLKSPASPPIRPGSTLHRLLVLMANRICERFAQDVSRNPSRSDSTRLSSQDIERSGKP